MFRFIPKNETNNMFILKNYANPFIHINAVNFDSSYDFC